MAGASSSDSSESPLKRFLQFLGFNRPPDTAEDLEQEIQELIEEGEESGLISEQEGKMINSILEFKDTLASEIMTPQTEMASVESLTPIPDVIKLITEKGFSRIPVYSETPDHIVGILHAKDLLSIASMSPPPTAGELAKPAYFVLESKKIVDLLRNFQNNKTHMAIVTDEFGSVRGLATLEDILEEIVGDIRDEYDVTTEQWKAVDENTVLTDAKVSIDEVEDYFKISMPEGPYESVGGLIIQQLGRVPEKGATTEINDLVFQVLSSTNRRIKTVKIQKAT